MVIGHTARGSGFGSMAIMVYTSNHPKRDLQKTANAPPGTIDLPVPLPCCQVDGYSVILVSP